MEVCTCAVTDLEGRGLFSFFGGKFEGVAGARFIMVRNTGKVLPAEDDPGKGSQVENSSGGEKDDSASGKEEQATKGVGSVSACSGRSNAMWS
jgi:hypothetical protein